MNNKEIIDPLENIFNIVRLADGIEKVRDLAKDPCTGGHYKYGSKVDENLELPH